MKSEMIESYRIMQLQNAAYNKVEADKIEANNVDSKEKTKVGFEPKSVTLDEYNQSLRDSVNAYYQHAQNDPTMSQEDAITSTAEMSENYLNSVEAFQASQGTAATSVESKAESQGKLPLQLDYLSPWHISISAFADQPQYRHI